MLSNKRILITGANGGIGCSICETFLKNNANLVLFYHNGRKNIDRILKNHSSQSEIQAHQVNLLNYKEIDESMDLVLKNGSIDAFVHSVTIPIKNKSMIDLPWSDFQSHIDLQTKSFFLIIKKLVPSMKIKKGGKL